MIQIYFCPIKTLTHFLIVELANVSTWFKSNKLSLNVHKTKWLLFHHLSKRQLSYWNMHIKREHVTTFLDVFIDANLFWKQHIEKVSSNISKTIGIFYKSRDVLSKQSLKQLYFSFIHNYVNYANIARASTCKSKLERIYRCHIHM